MLVDVAPPVIDRPFGLGDNDIKSLVLAPRSKSAVFKHPIEHPMPVLVYRILNPGMVGQGIVRDSDIKLSAWGEVYPTLEAADHAARVGDS